MSKVFLSLYDVDLQLLVSICNVSLSLKKFLRVGLPLCTIINVPSYLQGNMSYSTKEQQWRYSLQNSVFLFDLNKDMVNYFPEI